MQNTYLKPESTNLTPITTVLVMIKKIMIPSQNQANSIKTSAGEAKKYFYLPSNKPIMVNNHIYKNIDCEPKWYIFNENANIR